MTFLDLELQARLGPSSQQSQSSQELASKVSKIHFEVKEICDALWKFEATLLLVEAATLWREHDENESKTLDAMEFFLCSWLKEHQPHLVKIKSASDKAHHLTSKLLKEIGGETSGN